MSGGLQERKLAAIMFTDMVGYSALAQRDETLALALLAEHHELVRRVLPRHQGTEIKTTGDGFLVEFTSALAAVRCAMEVQKTLAERNAVLPTGQHVKIRIGIHLGDVVRREGDVIGDGVNIAARVVPLAEPGGICLSRAVFEQVQGKVVETVTSIGEVELKNLPRPVEVFRVELHSNRGDPDLTDPECGVRSARFSQNLASVVPPQESLAVLPFVNMSPDQENEFLGDGITEDLIMALSRVKGLRVPARTSSFAFKGKNEDIRRIGQLLNVETVLEGSVRKSGNKLRITAQLVKVRDGFHLWSDRYDREMEDVFDIQDDITRAIVSELQVQLRGAAETLFVRPQTGSMAAYEAYVRGRAYWNQSGVGLKKALHCFELALLEDPDYALAWSGLADAYAMMGFYDLLPCREALAKARAAAERAVALDPQSAETHCSLGLTLGMDLNVSRGELELERALQLNPSYSIARWWYATHLAGEGRDEEALDQCRLTVEGDPLSVFANVHLGWMHMVLGQYEEALPPLRRCLELEPNTAMGRWILGQTLWCSGQREPALAELEHAVDLSDRNPMFLASVGWALALSGQTSRAREIQRELAGRTTPAPTRPLFFATVHAALGENDQAFAALERALAERELWLPLAHAMTGLRILASDPRWPLFLGKVAAIVRASSMPASGSGSGVSSGKTETTELTDAPPFAWRQQQERLPELIGPYRVRDLLSATRMSKVYRAEEEQPRRTVALKILPKNRTFSPEAREAFLNEVSLAASICAAGVVPVLNMGETDGAPYYTMPFIEGRSLGDHFKRDQLRLPAHLSARLDVFEKTCGLVCKLHHHPQRLVHGDLKPTNIMVDRNGDVWLLDFGLARATKARSVAGELAPRGTPPYMAFEQTQARPGQSLTAATDVHALGVLLYQILTDASPYPLADSIARFAQILQDHQPAPPSQKCPWLSDRYDALVMACLSRQPGERPADAGQLLDLLQRARRGDAAVRPVPLKQRRWRTKALALLGAFTLRRK